MQQVDTMTPPASPRLHPKHYGPHHGDPASTPGLWVFGYGSLCWHPGFDFDQSLTGFITGWTRRFWQGNTTHRGIEGKPGRVATLVEEKESAVWGRAFAVRGDAALPYLNTRECTLGGYRTQLVTFRPRCCPHDSFPVLVYIATPSNTHWLGEAPLPAMANQIVSSKGASGHNVEYVLRLAAFMRANCPGIDDSHLFDLEKFIRVAAAEQRLCLSSLMGGLALAEVEDGIVVDSPCEAAAAAAATSSSASSSGDEDDEEGAVGGVPPPQPPQPPQPLPPPSFEYSSRVPPKTLRCLNI